MSEWVSEWKSLSCVRLCDPMDYIQSREFSRPAYWSGFPSPGNLPNPVIKRRSPALQVDTLPAEPQAKSKNTGVGSLSFLQGIFLTQESNQGLLHCRQILYQLSYQGSPFLSWEASFSTELLVQGYPSGSVVKNPRASAGGMRLSPGLGRSHVPQSNQAHVPQLLSLRALQQQRSHRHEKPTHCD